MRVAVKKWGNSAAVRIPASVMAATNITLNQEVSVREQDGMIVIEPVRRKIKSLSEYVAEITPDNIHGLIDFGPDVGREIIEW
jgi:antitoxin MazE